MNHGGAAGGRDATEVCVALSCKRIGSVLHTDDRDERWRHEPRELARAAVRGRRRLHGGAAYRAANHGWVRAVSLDRSSRGRPPKAFDRPAGDERVLAGVAKKENADLRQRHGVGSSLYRGQRENEKRKKPFSLLSNSKGVSNRSREHNFARCLPPQASISPATSLLGKVLTSLSAIAGVTHILERRRTSKRACANTMVGAEPNTRGKTAPAAGGSRVSGRQQGAATRPRVGGEPRSAWSTGSRRAAAGGDTTEVEP